MAKLFKGKDEAMIAEAVKCASAITERDLLAQTAQKTSKISTRTRFFVSDPPTQDEWEQAFQLVKNRLLAAQSLPG